MLFRVALHGFAESDLRGLASFLHQTGGREPGYRLAHRFADADVILVNGDSAQAIASVVGAARIATSLFLSADRPAEATWHVERPTSPERLLTGLDELSASLALVAPDARAAAPAGESDRHARAKAAARRARLAASANAVNASRIQPDVLVLDRQDQDRDHLCALLERFGFCAYPARSNLQALWLLETRPFRAAFLDIALDGSDEGVGVELCQRVKNGSRLTILPLSALFIMLADCQPADRIRATLAGADALLLKPLSRGDVARALETSGVLMPADDRRA